MMVRLFSFFCIWLCLSVGVAFAADSTSTSDLGEDTGVGTVSPKGGSSENAVEDTPPVEEVQSEILEKEVKSPWDTFVPPWDDPFDWLQLKSGEWLKGELIGYFNFALEFDSLEMDGQEFDWSDVLQIRTGDYQAVRIERYEGDAKPKTVDGRLLLVGDNATLFFEEEVVAKFRRDQIIAIAKKASSRLEVWSASVSFGSSARSGNSDKFDASMAVEIGRTTAGSRFETNYLGTYSEAENEVSANDHRVESHLDLFRTSVFFLRPIMGEYYRDVLTNINHQVSLSTGFGYHVLRAVDTKWEVIAGAGGIYKNYVSVEPGEDKEDASPSLNMRTVFTKDLTSHLEFKFDYGFQLVYSDLGQYIHHVVTGLETDLLVDLDLEFTFVWDRVQEPQPAADGTVAEKDDFKTIVSFGYDF